MPDPIIPPVPPVVDPPAPPPVEDPPAPPTEDKVAYDTYKKVLDEKKAMQKKLNDFEQKAKSEKDADLKAKEQYKELLTEREKELAEAKEKLSAKEKETNDYLKLNTFLKKIKGEIPQQFWGLIDLDKILMDDDGAIEEASVQKLVKDFEKTFSQVILKKDGPRMPNDPASGGEGSLSYEEWLKLDVDEMRKRRKDVKQ